MTARHVLLVDDDTVFSQTLSRAFVRRGHLCTWVERTSDLEALLRTPPAGISDVVLDLNLGESSGLQWIQALRRAYPAANVLLLTGYASIATTVQAIKLGADNVLAKPADAASILRALDQDAEGCEPTFELTDAQVMSVPRLEWEHIQRVLTENEGNISATARALNMHRRTLQRKLSKRPVGR